MKLTLAEAKYLKNTIAIISELVSEAKFKINKTAMELVAMDPANVAMIVFKLFSSSFVEYKLEKDTEISLNLSNLKQVLRRASDRDLITMELDNNRLKVSMKGNVSRTFYLPIIDLEDREHKVPELNFKVKIVCEPAVIEDAIMDADVVSDSLTFMFEKEKLTIKAEGDLNQSITEIGPNENTNIIFDESSAVKSKYSIEYLKKMIKADKLTDTMEIQMSQDYPLKMSFIEKDKMALYFILAPRVDND